MSELTLPEVVDKLRRSAERTNSPDTAACLLKMWVDAQGLDISERSCQDLIDNALWDARRAREEMS